MDIFEKNGLKKKQEIADLKRFLEETDYVVSKIAEANALGKPTEPLLSKYADTLRQREEARQRIDELEG